MDFLYYLFNLILQFISIFDNWIVFYFNKKIEL